MACCYKLPSNDSVKVRYFNVILADLIVTHADYYIQAISATCMCVYPFSAYPISAVSLQCFDAVGWPAKGHLAWKKWMVGCWHGYLSGVRCRLANFGLTVSHEDGSVRFWDVSSAGIRLLYKLTTADMFGGYYRGDMSDIDADEEWPPFRKVSNCLVLSCYASAASTIGAGGIRFQTCLSICVCACVRVLACCWLLVLVFHLSVETLPFVTEWSTKDCIWLSECIRLAVLYSVSAKILSSV